MARAKKNETTMTLEEKLEQALVPDWEWPYKLPSNWCWTKAGYLVKLYRGVSYNKNDAHTEKRENDCLIMRGGNILEGELNIDADNVYVDRQLVTKEQFIQKSDIIIVSSTGSKKVIGRAGIAMSDYDDIAFGAFLTLLRPLDFVSKKFVGYYFQSDLYRERVRSLAGGVNINNIRAEHITDAPFPLPPITEQQRIVDRIESLFAKLDEAKEKAQATLDSFETRKAAILHKAFTGELTEQWRKEKSISYNDRKKFSLKECCQIGSGGTPSRNVPGYYSGNIPWIKTGEINWNEITDAEEKISESAIENSSAKLYAPGAVLVAMYGMGVTRGRAAILQILAATNQAVCVLTPSEYLFNKYLFYYFMCNYWEIREQAVGGNQLNLSATIIGKFEIDVPSIIEQHEIVRILDSIFSKEQKVQEDAEAVLERIDLMKKAILSRAFRGELGTNDPTEESAVELLKQIL